MLSALSPSSAVEPRAGFVKTQRPPSRIRVHPHSLVIQRHPARTFGISLQPSPDFKPAPVEACGDGIKRAWQHDSIIESYRVTLVSVIAGCSFASELETVYRVVHAATNPFSIDCTANSCGGPAPAISTASQVSRTVPDCRVQHSPADGGPHAIPDVTQSNSMLHASQALDHLRELRAHHLAINHGITRTSRAVRESSNVTSP